MEHMTLDQQLSVVLRDGQAVMKNMEKNLIAQRETATGPVEKLIDYADTIQYLTDLLEENTLARRSIVGKISAKEGISLLHLQDFCELSEELIKEIELYKKSTHRVFKEAHQNRILFKRLYVAHKELFTTLAPEVSISYSRIIEQVSPSTGRFVDKSF